MNLDKRRCFLFSSNIDKLSFCTVLAAALFFGGCCPTEDGKCVDGQADAAIGNCDSEQEQVTSQKDADTSGVSKAINTEEVLQEVLDMLSDECAIGVEEQDFYKELYQREYGKTDKAAISEEELSEFISGYYAEFYLADYYGIREAFSYEALNAQWEVENESRKEKKQEGEIFYGPVEYELLDYFGYLYSNLKLENIEAIVLHADEELLAQGRTYYEENSEIYDDLIGAVCKLSDGERQEERVFSYDDIQSLYKTNEAVFSFIKDSEPGSTMQYQNGDRTVTVELISKEIDHREFDDMRGVIMNDYVQREFYDAFIAGIASEIHLSMK